MLEHAAFIRRETLGSIAINLAINPLVFYLMFGFDKPIPMWGMGNWIFDFLPLSFIVTLMCVLAPGAQAMKKIRAGKLETTGQSSRLPRNLAVRALLFAVPAAIIGTALMAMLGWLSGLGALNVTPALTLKVIYAAILAAIITPIGLRATLATRRI